MAERPLIYSVSVETRRQSVLLFDFGWERACRVTQIFHLSAPIWEWLPRCSKYCSWGTNKFDWAGKFTCMESTKNEEQLQLEEWRWWCWHQARGGPLLSNITGTRSVSCLWNFMAGKVTMSFRHPRVAGNRASSSLSYPSDARGSLPLELQWASWGGALAPLGVWT